MSFRSPLVVVAGLLLGLAGLRIAAEQPTTRKAPPKPAAFRPVAPVEALMHGQDDTYAAIRRSFRKRDHEALALQAYLLAEFANVNVYHSKQKDYRDIAMKMRQDALDLAEAAAKKDFKTSGRCVKRINTRCEACHGIYR